MRHFRLAALALVLPAVLTGVASSVVAGDDPRQVAAEVDRLLADEILQGKSLAPVVNDEAFLRRVSLDILGEPPGPAEITAFALDSASDKRIRVVDRLLAQPLYGQNWAHYWRDVMMARRSDQQ